LFADLDSFNAINQRYGYAAGDHALLVVSQHWQRTLQQIAPQATLARMGGDEFACLLVAPLEIQRAEEIAQRLLDAVHEPLLMENEKCALTASIGIARSPEHGRQVEELLRSAELAMNTAKTRGKGRWCWHTASANRTPAALQAKG
jgi:diguanylate cyclase (GGDEF)-like protein